MVLALQKETSCLFVVAVRYAAPPARYEIAARRLDCHREIAHMEGCTVELIAQVADTTVIPDLVPSA